MNQETQSVIIFSADDEEFELLFDNQEKEEHIEDLSKNFKFYLEKFSGEVPYKSNEESENEKFLV